MESGVAQKPITNWEEYVNQLNHRLGNDNQLMRAIGSKARKDPKRVVFADAENIKVLKAAQLVYEEGVAYPILLGDENNIRELAELNGLKFKIHHGSVTSMPFDNEKFLITTVGGMVFSFSLAR